MNENGGAMAKGTGMLSTVRWIREHYGSDVHRRLLASLPRDVARAYGRTLATEWYPVHYVDAMQAALEEHHNGDVDAFRRAMIAQGRFIAEDNLSTVFRVLLIFVGSPSELFRTLGKFWNQYFQGIEVEVDETSVDEGRGVCTVHHLGGVRHLSPLVYGWTDYGFRKVGATEVEVEERAYERGQATADPLVFEISWR